MKRIFTALMCIALAACGGSGDDGDQTPSTAVAGVSLNEPSFTLATNGSRTLTATVAPSTAINKDVVWSSTDPATATVSTSGLVTAVDVGQTTITATTAEGNHQATCTVKVEVQKAGWETLSSTQIRFTDTVHDAWISFYFTDRKCTSAQAQFNYGTNQAATISFNGLSVAARDNGEVNGTYFWVDVAGTLLTPFANKTMAQIVAISDVYGDMYMALLPQ